MRGGILAAVLAVILTCGGCGQSQPKAPLDYAEGGFEAAVSGEMGGVEFEARVVAAAPDAAGNIRDVSIEFFAPDPMAGVKMTRRQGVVSCECGDVAFEAASWAWLDAADLLCADGRVTSVSKLPDSSRVVVGMQDGNRAYTLTVDAATRQPISATLTSPRHVEVKVTGFLGG